jgi:hypothetical protein
MMCGLATGPKPMGAEYALKLLKPEAKIKLSLSIGFLRYLL